MVRPSDPTRKPCWVVVAERLTERLLTDSGKTPPLNAQGAALYRAHDAERKQPQPQFDRTRWCAGPGMPRIMFMPYPFEIRADGRYVGFIYGWYRWHRMVDMSGQGRSGPAARPWVTRQAVGGPDPRHRNGRGSLARPVLDATPAPFRRHGAHREGARLGDVRLELHSQSMTRPFTPRHGLP